MTRLLAATAAVAITFGVAGVVDYLSKSNKTTKTAAVIRSTNAAPQTILVPTVNVTAAEPKLVSAPSMKHVNKLSLPQDRTIFILGEIGYLATAIARQISTLNSESDEPIYLVIDSPGGSVIRGALIISAIEASRAPIYTVCYNICASMAAQIHQYGKKRYALDRSILMFHWATAGTMGDVNRMLSFSEFVTRYVDKMDANVIMRSGMNKAVYERLIARDMWNDAEDAMALNLVDDLVYLDTESSKFFQDVVDDLKYKKDYIDSVDFLTMGGLWKPSSH